LGPEARAIVARRRPGAPLEQAPKECLVAVSDGHTDVSNRFSPAFQEVPCGIDAKPMRTVFWKF
jgi:hypothetical protein